MTVPPLGNVAVSISCNTYFVTGTKAEMAERTPMRTEAMDTQGYKERLAPGDEAERVEIYREIGQSTLRGDIRLLIDGLIDPSPRVASVISDILTQSPETDKVEMLLERLRSEDPGMRSCVMSILAGLGLAALPKLVVYLNDPDTDVRIASAVILGTSGLQEAFPALVAVMQDPEREHSLCRGRGAWKDRGAEGGAGPC